MTENNPQAENLAHSSPTAPWASSATARTCRATACPPAKWRASGLAAAAACRSRKKPSPGLDEDVITMSIEAARNALARAGIDPAELRAVWVGSESHPYAVKPTCTIVAEAIGAVPRYPGRRLGVRLQGRHRSAWSPPSAWSARAWRATPWPSAWTPPRDARRRARIHRRRRRRGLHGRPGRRSRWRSSKPPIPTSPTRPISGAASTQKYPEHGQRFTGEPAYFKHITDRRQSA